MLSKRKSVSLQLFPKTDRHHRVHRAACSRNQTPASKMEKDRHRNRDRNRSRYRSCRSAQADRDCDHDPDADSDAFDAIGCFCKKGVENRMLQHCALQRATESPGALCGCSCSSSPRVDHCFPVCTSLSHTCFASFAFPAPGRVKVIFLFSGAVNSSRSLFTVSFS